MPNDTQRWGIRVVEPENELSHYGRPGQHWGQRLYQNKDGSLTPLGRLRYGRKPAGVSVRKKKTKEEKKQAKEAALQKKEEKKKQKEAEEKERIIKSGDAETILKNKDKLSSNDLREAAARLQLEQQISGYMKKAEKVYPPNPEKKHDTEKNNKLEKKIDQVFEKGDYVIDKIERTGKATAKVAATYNTIAKLTNFATGENTLKVIEDLGYYKGGGGK
jgi:hypothetical protein